MEHIYKNIMHHLEDNNTVFANQHGFQKNHSCETQLILAVEDLAMNLDLGGQMDMIILDFSKALDFRLHANGRNNSQHCCANNVESCCVHVGSGVKTDVTTLNIVRTYSAS